MQLCPGSAPAVAVLATGESTASCNYALGFLPPLRSPFLCRCPDDNTYSGNVPNVQPSAKVSSYYDPPHVNPKYRVQCVFF
jgi:hypothetical protein